jgi:hypothetical protein
LEKANTPPFKGKNHEVGLKLCFISASYFERAGRFHQYFALCKDHVTP